MRAYFKEYVYIARAGLLHASHQMIIATGLFMFLFGKYLGVGLEVFIFILTPIGYMLDFDSNKYVINYSMPICIKRRVMMLYYMMITGAFVAVTMVHLRYCIEGQSRSMTLNLIIFMTNIIGGNLYYYLFSSPEFKKDILDDDKKQLAYQCVLGVMIGISVSDRLKYGIADRIDHYISSLGYGQSIIIISMMFVFTLWWTKYSMKKFEDTVRNCTQIEVNKQKKVMECK